MNDYELYHWGVKGMKWGVRRYQNKDGSLTPKGIKRYAKAGYAEDSYKSNKTVLGKTWDKVTGAHKTAGKIEYDLSTDAENRARAEKYVADKKVRSEQNKQAMKKAAIKTAAKGAEIATNLAFYSALDDIFYGGELKKAAKEDMIHIGRAAVTAYTMARGGYDIHWYDN